MAPELYRDDQEKTKESDVFAFAMLIIEVFSKSFPSVSDHLLKLSRLTQGESHLLVSSLWTS